MVCEVLIDLQTMDYNLDNFEANNNNNRNVLGKAKEIIRGSGKKDSGFSPFSLSFIDYVRS